MTAHDRTLTLSHSRKPVALGLWQWINSGSIETALAAMANKVGMPHWGSKGAVNRAGEALRNDTLGDGQAEVLESWRMAHRDVINTFQAMLRARAKNLDIEVAQRLYEFDLELEASTKLLELEKEFPAGNIVLVGAQTVEELKSAFRNYFNDVRDFLNLMVKAYEACAPEIHAKKMTEFAEKKQ